MDAGLRIALRFAALVGTYVAGAWLAAQLLHGPDQVTLIWLPAGIALAALVLYGRRYWPFIPLAEAIVQSLPPAADASFIAFTALANTLAALAAASLVEAHRSPDHGRFVVRSSYLLMLAALLLAVVSAVIGVSGLLVVGYVGSSELDAAFIKWVIANFFGVVLVAPAVLLLARSLDWGRREIGDDFGSRREGLIWAAALALSLGLLAHADRTTSNYALGLSSLPLALLIWSALRFPPLVTAVAALLVGLLLTLLAGLGLGGFSQPDTLIDAVILLVFLSVIAVVPLLLSGAANENRIATRQLLRRARTDDLTGLANRYGFEAAAEARLASPQRAGLGLLYLDLDNFKVVNDTAGHAAGDRLVQSLAGVLRAALRRGDVLARLGGDEFALLASERTRAELDDLAQQLRRAIADYRFAHGGHIFSTTASVGVLQFAGSAYGDALAQVDAACFTAKELGGNRVQWGGDSAAVSERTSAMKWASRITEGIEQDLFRIFCQSIAPLQAQVERGRHFEVLIRLWDPAQQKLLSPGQFVPAAERFRLGPALDRHVIDRSLRWLEARPDWAANTDCCSINLCAGSVDDEGFLGFLQERLARSSVAAERLCFEITETSAVRDLGEARRFIDGVRALGCRLALDDFGTGFCSFAYLDTLDVDYIKIDGSFVRQLGKSVLAEAIVKAIADIGRRIDKRTIAEFAENAAIREQLLALHVDYAQGYAIDEPVPIEDYFARPMPTL